MLLNKERMLEKMEEFDLDALIATYPENVTYLSGLQNHRSYMYRFYDAIIFALFPRRSDIAPALIMNKGDTGPAAAYPSWIEEVYTFGNTFHIVSSEKNMSQAEARCKQMLDAHEKNAPSAGQALVKALKEKGLDKGRVGLDEEHLNPAIRERIVSGLPNAQILDAFELFRIVRMVKTPEELDRLTKVGLLNERATQSVLDRMADGVSEEELTQQFMESVGKEGAVFEFWNTRSGTQSAMSMMSFGHLHPPSGYHLKQGDIFKYDGGSIYNRYHSDAGGCAVLGAPTRKQKACYHAIEAGMGRAMELLRPGALPSEILKEVAGTVEKAGLTDYSKVSGFCGHGIGIEARDYPIFSPPVKSRNPFLPGSYDFPIEENMVINIEVPYAELGLGGFQIEYTLLVKKDGCEKLYSHKRELVVR